MRERKGRWQREGSMRMPGGDSGTGGLLEEIGTGGKETRRIITRGEMWMLAVIMYRKLRWGC